MQPIPVAHFASRMEGRWTFRLALDDGLAQPAPVDSKHLKPSGLLFRDSPYRPRSSARPLRARFRLDVPLLTASCVDSGHPPTLTRLP